MEAIVTIVIAALSGLGILHSRHMARIHELDRRTDAVEVKIAEKYVTKECFETVFQIQKSNVDRVDNKIEHLMLNMRHK